MTLLPKVIVRRGLASIYLNPSADCPFLELLSLKAWSALVLPEQGRWAEKYRAEKRSLLRMEFRTFCVALIQVPCQIVRTAHRIVFRLLSWNPWQGVFLRLVERLHGRRLC